MNHGLICLPVVVYRRAAVRADHFCCAQCNLDNTDILYVMQKIHQELIKQMYPNVLCALLSTLEPPLAESQFFCSQNFCAVFT